MEEQKNKFLRFLLPLISAFLVIFLFFSSICLGFDGKDTHPEITKEAIKLEIEKQGSSGNAEFVNEVGSKEDQLNMGAFIKLGSENEDQNWHPYDADQVDLYPWAAHFYDPSKKDDPALWIVPLIGKLFGAKNALERAKELFRKAVKQYKSETFKNHSYFTLGRVIHLVQDMFVPGHTNDDCHSFLDRKEAVELYTTPPPEDRNDPEARNDLNKNNLARIFLKHFIPETVSTFYGNSWEDQFNSFFLSAAWRGHRSLSLTEEELKAKFNWKEENRLVFKWAIEEKQGDKYYVFSRGDGNKFYVSAPRSWNADDLGYDSTLKKLETLADLEPNTLYHLTIINAPLEKTFKSDWYITEMGFPVKEGNLWDIFNIKTQHWWKKNNGTFYLEDLEKVSPFTDFKNASGEEKDKTFLGQLAIKAINGATSFTAALIDFFWKVTHTINIPPDPPPPAGDHSPDDSFSVASPFFSGNETPVDNLVRLGLKKGKELFLYYKKAWESFALLNNLPPDASFKEWEEASQTARAFSETKKVIGDNALLLEAEIQATPDVAILREGYYKSTKNLLEELKEPFLLVDIDNLLEISQKILIIPTGALFGLEDSCLFRLKLEKFVERGGTIICFSQSQGTEYQVLPRGNEIVAKGYREAQSCQSRNAEIDTYAPFLSPMKGNLASTAQDGYFSLIPLGSTIYLRTSTRGGYPILFSYPLGKGRVYVTSLYSDWGLGQSQLSAQEKAIISALICYGKGEEIADFSPKEIINLSVEVKNISLYDSSQVLFFLYGPGGSLLKRLPFSLKLKPKEAKSFNFIFPALSELGLYRLNFSLLNENGDTIQPETEGTAFTVSIFKTLGEGYLKKGEEISYSISLADEMVSANSKVYFSVSLFNQGSKEREIVVKFRGEEEKIYLPASSQGSTQFSFTAPGYTCAHLLRVEFFDVKGSKLGSLSRFCYVVVPSLLLTITPEKNLYHPGEEVKTSLRARDERKVNSSIKLKIFVKNPLNEVIFSSEKEATLSAGTIFEEKEAFSLPSDAQAGVYLFLVEAFFNGERVASAVNYFEIPSPKISLKPVLPDYFKAGYNEVTFVFENISLCDLDGAHFSLKLISPQRETLFEEIKRISISQGEERKERATIPLNQVELGIYELSFWLEGHGKWGGKLALPATLSINGKFDKASYKVREGANFQLSIVNTGRFELEPSLFLKVPDLDWVKKEQFSFLPGQKKDFSFTLSLPEDFWEGRHQTEVTVTQSESILTKRFSFAISPPSLSLELEKEMFIDGEFLPLKISNNGGIDTNYSCRVSLIDRFDELVLGDTIKGFLLAGETTTLALLLPEHLVSGSYYFEANCVDFYTGEEKVLRKNIKIEGLKVDFSLKTEKEFYFKDDPINALIEVISESHFEDGLLKISVDNIVPRLKATWEDYHSLGGITALLENEENLWIGTKGSGLFKWQKEDSTWQVFTTSNSGLSSNRIYSLALDGNSLWIGTDKKLCQFFPNSEPSSAWKELEFTEVHDVLVDGDYLWLATSNGLVKFNKEYGNYSIYNTKNSDLETNYVWCLASQGNYIWIGTNKGLYRISRNFVEMKFYGSAVTGLKTDIITDLAVDGENLLVAGRSLSGASLYCYNPSTGWETLLNEPPYYLVNVSSISLGDGKIYALTKEDTLVEIDKETGEKRGYSIYHPYQSLSNYEGDCLFSKDKVWIGSEFGLFKMHLASKKIDKITYRGGDLLGEVINALSLQGSSLWIGTNKGLNQLDLKENNWKSFDKAHTSVSSACYDIEIDQDKIWVSSWQGISIYNRDSGSWERVFASQDGFLSNEVPSLSITDKYVWVGTAEGLCRFDKQKGEWKSLNLFNLQLPSDYIRQVEANDNEVWLIGRDISENFLARYDLESESIKVFDRFSADDLGNPSVIELFGEEVWVGTEKGLFKYDRNSETWLPLAKPLLSFPVTSIACFQDEIWVFAKYYSYKSWKWEGWLCRYDKKENSWLVIGNKKGLPSGNINSLSVDGSCVWLGGGEALYRYNKANDSWTSFSFYYPYSYGRRIWSVKSKEDEVWFAFDYGVACFDSGQEKFKVFTYYNTGLGDDWILSLSSNLDMVWVGTNYGLSAYEPILKKWTCYCEQDFYQSRIKAVLEDGGNLWLGEKALWYYSKNSNKWEKVLQSGLSSVSALCQSPGFIWVGTEGNGIFCYEKESGSWKNFSLSNLPLPSNQISSLLFDGKVLWVGTDQGLFCWDFEDNNWQIFTSSNSSLPSSQILSLSSQGELIFIGTSKGLAVSRREGVLEGSKDIFETFDGERNKFPNETINSLLGSEDEVWLGTNGGLINLKLQRTLIGENFFSQEVKLGSPESTTMPLDAISATGKFFLKGALISPSGQVVRGKAYPFYVFDGKIGVMLESEKEFYRAGEEGKILGKVINLGQETFSDTRLEVFKGEEVLFNQEINLFPSRSYPFEVEFVADSDAFFKAVVTHGKFNYFALEEIKVRNPLVEMTLDAPSLVGREPFTVKVKLKNVGEIPANLRLSLNKEGELSEGEEFLLEAGASKTFSKNFTLSRETTMIAHLSGDVEKTLEQKIDFGERVILSLEPELVYPEGEVEIPYILRNIGSLGSNLRITFQLRNLSNGEILETTSEAFLLPAEQSEEFISFPNLREGDYKLKAFTPFEEKEVSFKVVPLEKIEGSIVLGQASGGILQFVARLTNNSFSHFEGRVVTSCGFYHETKELKLRSGESTEATFSLDLTKIDSSQNELKITVEDLAGKIVWHTTKELLLTSQFEAFAWTEKEDYLSGDEVKGFLKVKNIGLVGGKANLKIEFEEDFRDQKSIFLYPEEEKEISFQFKLPSDLAEGIYPLVCWVNGTKKVLNLSLEGVKISVESYFDKEFYQLGEEALFTIKVINLSSHSANLRAEVKYGSYEEEKSFILNDQAILTFKIPAEEINQKVFYGIYNESGVGLYLNTTYFRIRKGKVILLPEKEVYYPGEKVKLKVYSCEEGTLTAYTPVGVEELYFSGETSFSFALPEEVKKGSYFIDYLFNEEKGRTFFDVEASSLKVNQCLIKKRSEGKKVYLYIEVVLSSSNDVRGTFLGWVVHPDGERTGVIKEEIMLKEGLNLFNFQGEFEREKSGIHRFLYGIYRKEFLLIGGEKLFDLERATLLSLLPRQEVYKEGEEAKAFVSLLSEEGAELKIFLSEKEIFHQNLIGEGYQEFEVLLGKKEGGKHILRAQILEGGEVVSEKACSFVVGDVQISKVLEESKEKEALEGFPLLSGSNMADTPQLGTSPPEKPVEEKLGEAPFGRDGERNDESLTFESRSLVNKEVKKGKLSSRTLLPMQGERKESQTQVEREKVRTISERRQKVERRERNKLNKLIALLVFGGVAIFGFGVGAYFFRRMW